MALACKGPLNARLATGVGLSFFLSKKRPRTIVKASTLTERYSRRPTARVRTGSSHGLVPGLAGCRRSPSTLAALAVGTQRPPRAQNLRGICTLSELTSMSAAANGHLTSQRLSAWIRIPQPPPAGDPAAWQGCGVSRGALCSPCSDRCAIRCMAMHADRSCDHKARPPVHGVACPGLGDVSRGW